MCPHIDNTKAPADMRSLGPNPPAWLTFLAKDYITVDL